MERKKMCWKQILCAVSFAFLFFFAPVKVVSASDGWGDFGSNIQWYFHDNTGLLEISGSGAMPEEAWNAPWDNYSDDIKKVIIKEGITTISYEAFRGASNLREVSLPSSLVSIGKGAFWDSGLKKVTLPNNLREIGENAFYDCDELSYVKIPGTVKVVSDDAFAQSDGLKTVVLSPGIETLGFACFAYTGITDISIPSSVKMIDSMAFQGCDNLRSVTIPSTVTEMGDAVFSYCENLKYAYFNASTMIPDGTFNSAGVEVVKIGEVTTGIGPGVFAWSDLKEIYIPRNVTEIYSSALSSMADEIRVYSYPGSAAWRYAGLKDYITFIDVSTSSGLSAWNQVWNTVNKIYLSSANTQVSISRSSYNYNGKSHTPSVTVTYKGKVLKNKTDYTLSYSSGRKNVGKYTVKINFRGKYKGSISKTFKVIPAPTAITKLQSQRPRWLNIQYRANRASDGYQIQYGTNSNMSGAKYVAVRNSAIRSYTRKDVRRRTTYYVRVRTFKIVGGERIYSNWSGVKRITVK